MKSLSNHNHPKNYLSIVFIILAALFLSSKSKAQTFSNLKSADLKLSKQLPKKDDKEAKAFVETFKPKETQKSTIDSELQNWKEAATFARDEKKEVGYWLEAQNRFPDLFSIPENPRGKEKQMKYIILAKLTDKQLVDYFGKLSITAKDKAIIEKEISAIRSDLLALKESTVSVYLTGDAKGVATNSTAQSTTNATGSMGISFTLPKLILVGRVALASTQDSISSGVGAFLLSPANGKALKSGLIEAFAKINDQNNWIHLYGTVASSTWKIEQNPTTKEVLAKSASTAGLGALYRRQLAGGEIKGLKTYAGMDAEIGLAGRWISGDIRSLMIDDLNKAKYLKVFPTERKFFFGFEGGFTLTFGQLTAGLQAFYFFPKKHEPIEGLTGLQVLAGISLRADIINDIFNSK